MVSPVLAQAILGQKAPDIVGQFEAGQEKSRQLQARELAGQALATGGGEALTELQKIAPEVAIQISNQIGARSSQQLDDFVKSAGITRRLLESGDEAGALQFANQRMQIAQQQGMNPGPVQTVRDMIAQGQTDQALNQLRAFDDSIAQATAAEREFKTLTSGLSPEEAEKAKRIKLGLEPRATAVTAERERELAAAKETGKGITKRQQTAIDQGLAAADSTATIRRSLDLLKEIKTGGVDAASLKARQFFGVEGADEGELSANLGKSVLSQLRSTFGAAFTEKEGQRLASIEAGFGRSPATNKRLLQNALAISERAAKRGKSAARSAGDIFAIEEIDKALKFELGAKPAPPSPPPSGGGAGQIKILGVR